MKALIETSVNYAASMLENHDVLNSEFLLILSIIQNSGTLSGIRYLLNENDFSQFVYGCTGSHVWVKQKSQLTGKVLNERIIFVSEAL